MGTETVVPTVQRPHDLGNCQLPGNWASFMHAGIGMFLRATAIAWQVSNCPGTWQLPGNLATVWQLSGKLAIASQVLGNCLGNRQSPNKFAIGASKLALFGKLAIVRQKSAANFFANCTASSVGHFFAKLKYLPRILQGPQGQVRAEVCRRERRI